MYARTRSKRSAETKESPPKHQAATSEDSISRTQEFGNTTRPPWYQLLCLVLFTGHLGLFLEMVSMRLVHPQQAPDDDSPAERHSRTDQRGMGRVDGVTSHRPWYTDCVVYLYEPPMRLIAPRLAHVGAHDIRPSATARAATRPQAIAPARTAEGPQDEASAERGCPHDE